MVLISSCLNVWNLCLIKKMINILIMVLNPHYQVVKSNLSWYNYSQKIVFHPKIKKNLNVKTYFFM